jgi:uncharacterized protein (DUF302 family)
MSVMDSMMDGMINRMPKEKREAMMVDMMPMMMEGIDMHEFMPKMMTEMLKDVTVDDVINFLKAALQDKDKLVELLTKLKEADLMQQMMTKVYKSKFNFEETLSAITEAAPKNGWHIDTRDLQKQYHETGETDMTRLMVFYFCDPHGGYKILKDDKNKALSIMMPMGVSVYETSDGQVEIATWNMGMMSDMVADNVGAVFSNGAKNLEKALEGIVE